jgi:hypothetical protein
VTEFESDPRSTRIAAAAVRLNELREMWLNPPDLIAPIPEVVPGFPFRRLPKGDREARELKKRTLTNLYNASPAWLKHAHRELDEAVAAAYGWVWPMTDDEILDRLLSLNQLRAGRQIEGGTEPAGQPSRNSVTEPELDT